MASFVAYATMEEPMDGENRTPDKIIGDIPHAEEQTERTIEQQREKEDERAYPKRDPAKKKTGEF